MYALIIIASRRFVITIVEARKHSLTKSILAFLFGYVVINTRKHFVILIHSHSILEGSLLGTIDANNFNWHFHNF